MLHKRSRLPARSAFTLIELLVVIAIIAILVGLLSSAVMKVFSTVKRTETSHDIMKLQDAFKVAMKQYGNTPVLPSRLLLYNDLSKYKTDTSDLSRRSAETLRKMFGRRFLEYGTFVAWDGVTNNAAPPFALEGQQCLVFYLGGMVENGKCVGFSTDPKNPTLPLAASSDRIGPFFEFKSSRLVAGNAPGRSFGTNAFFVYLDPYNDRSDPSAKPFAYFSSTTAPNNYNPYYTAPTPPVTSDCPSLGLWPYIEAPSRYINPNGFQIISAGADGLFGVGGGSPPTFSSSVYDPAIGARDLATRDNQSNFSQSVLGSPQN